MGFFDTAAAHDPRRNRPTEQQASSGRTGPPEGWVLPTVLPAVRVLGHTDKVRIALVGMRVWPDGVSFGLHVLRRWAPPLPRPGFGFPPEHDDWSFRFGVKFSDGRIAIAPKRLTPPPPDEDGVLLRQQSGGGGQHFRQYDFYLWPLPPRGRLTLVLDWPLEGIIETRTEFDAGEIRSAAARAVVVWPDLPKSNGSSSSYSASSTSVSTSTSVSASASASVTRRRSANDRES